MFKVNVYDVLTHRLGERMDGAETLQKMLDIVDSLYQGYCYRVMPRKFVEEIIVIPVQGCPFPAMIISKDV